MIDDKFFNYYKVIGRIQSLISKANSLDEALRDGIKTIIDACGAEYAVVWYKVNDALRPYYWICPVDLTSKSHAIGEGVVGKVYKDCATVRLLDYKKQRDKSIDDDFQKINISSMICVPFSNKYEDLGCIQIINEDSCFSEEEADICEILSGIIALSIDENPKITKEFNNKEVLISVQDIKKEYQNGDITTQVLKGINIDVYKGEFLALLGESGCGKSTLLNIIGGLDKATSGTFSYLGKDMSDASEDELTKYRRDNIGFIFQNYNLMPNLNAKQNLDLIGDLVEEPQDSKKILEMVGLEERKTNYPSELSGGQQQRVSIARSLVKNPKLIFADEPTAALDYETSIQVLSVLENVTKLGATLVMVTHNEEITKMADRVIRIRDGKVHEVIVNRHPLSAKELVW